MIDINGFPLSIFFMKGNYRDNKVFNKHIQDAIVILPKTQKTVLADKAYSSKQTYESLDEKNIKHIISPRKNMKLYSEYKYDKQLYIKRIKIEHISGRLKIIKRITNRYDKLLRNYAAFVYLAFTIIANNIIKKLNE